MSEKYVYAFVKADGSAVKIGCTSQPLETRRKQLQRQYDIVLPPHLAKTVPCPPEYDVYTVERTLHHYYAATHLSDEWFALDPVALEEFPRVAQAILEEQPWQTGAIPPPVDTTTTNPVEKLNALSTVRAHLASLPDTQRAALQAALPAEHWPAIAQLLADFAEHEKELVYQEAVLTAEIKAAVLSQGCGAVGMHLQVTYSEGRIGWDTKGLTTYAHLHPEILDYRKVGEPIIAIRTRKRETTRRGLF